MNIFQAVILGLVQGTTEFLPVSSSGHLVVFQNLFRLQEAQITFDVFLHFCTLAAIVIFFWKKIIKIKRGELLTIVVGTIPAVVFGLLIKDHVELLFSSSKLVAMSLIITGVLNFLSDRKIESKKALSAGKQAGKLKNKKIKGLKIELQQAFNIGLFQALAIIPGISRSGSTLLGGLSNKLNREAAFNFSFMLAIPAILGASALEALDLVQDGFKIQNPLVFLFGGLAAFVSGLFSLYLFKYVIKKARLEIFGWYCVGVGIFAFLFL